MKRYLLALGLAGSLLAGCRKADVIDCPDLPATPTTSLRDFFRRNGAPAQTFAVAIAPNQLPLLQVTTRAGATLRANADLWLLPNGAPASGQAEVRVREIYSVADMVLSDMPTDQPRPQAMLVSGGEFNVQVRLGGQRLRLVSTGRLEVLSPVPANQDSTTQLVWNQPRGIPTASSALVDSTGWVRATAPAVQKVAGQYRAFLPLDSIGWWNIDQYWGRYANATQTTVTVTTPATAPTADTRVYLRPSGVNGLARLVASGTAGSTWTRAMPVGTSQLAIVLQLRGGQLYYGTQPFTVQAGLTLTPPLAPVTEAQAVQLIRQL